MIVVRDGLLFAFCFFFLLLLLVLLLLLLLPFAFAFACGCGCCWCFAWWWWWWWYWCRSWHGAVGTADAAGACAVVFAGAGAAGATGAAAAGARAHVHPKYIPVASLCCIVAVLTNRLIENLPHDIRQLKIFPFPGHGVDLSEKLLLIVDRDLSAFFFFRRCCRVGASRLIICMFY